MKRALNDRLSDAMILDWVWTESGRTGSGL